jgi:hypothetical protein
MTRRSARKKREEGSCILHNWQTRNCCEAASQGKQASGDDVTHLQPTQGQPATQASPPLFPPACRHCPAAPDVSWPHSCGCDKTLAAHHESAAPSRSPACGAPALQQTCAPGLGRRPSFALWPCHRCRLSACQLAAARCRLHRPLSGRLPSPGCCQRAQRRKASPGVPPPPVQLPPRLLPPSFPPPHPEGTSLCWFPASGAAESGGSGRRKRGGCVICQAACPVGVHPAQTAPSLGAGSRPGHHTRLQHDTRQRGARGKGQGGQLRFVQHPRG